MAEVGQTEECDGPLDRHGRNEQHERHHKGGCRQHDFAGGVYGKATMEQPTRSAAAAQATDPGCDGRNPGESSNCFHIEAASVVKVLGEPEEIKVPACIGEEFGEHDAPRFAKAKELEPWNGPLGGRTDGSFSVRVLPLRLGQPWVLF